MSLFPQMVMNDTINGTAVTAQAWYMIDGEVWDVRIWGLVALAVGFIITAFGVGWTVKLNMFLLGLMIFAVLSVIIGSGVTPLTSWRVHDGFIGYSKETFTYVYHIDIV